MGQYYRPIVLHKTVDTPKACFSPYDYDNGAKLMEHSYVGNRLLNVIENEFAPGGRYYKSRLVWAGDYADSEKGRDDNLYFLSEGRRCKAVADGCSSANGEAHYYVDHTRKEYVSKDRLKPDGMGFTINPLPLLTAEGNGRGGGDYRGSDWGFVGRWARDVISMEAGLDGLEGYEEITPEFSEGL